ncbi:MAG TPA: mechanosensitive ion channel family protein [Gammaproteobacteria bacterium]|nr:mechanosensitive ion channel family protein [Gammaproteobacteria bacterium]
MNTFLHWLNGSIGQDAWVIGVFVTIFVALLADFIVRIIWRRLIRKAMRSSNFWDDALFEAAGKPISAGIWLLGITLAAGIVRVHTQSEIFEIVPKVRELGLVLVVGWFLFRLIRESEVRFLERYRKEGTGADQTTVEAIGKLLRMSVVITFGLVIMQSIGVNISGLLAFGGIGGLAIGFASKDMLANFFGGLTIYLDRPFAVGDWIRSPDREIEGTVEQIGWRRTVIRNFELRPLYVPNAAFTSITVENPSRMTNRRINETIGLRYDDINKVPAILAEVREMLRQHPDIDQDKTLMVYFDTFAESSLNFFIYTFTRTRDWSGSLQVKENVLLEIARIIERHGAEIAFPTRTVHVPEPLMLRDLVKAESNDAE